MNEDSLKLQLITCEKYGATAQLVGLDKKVGISRNVKEGVMPIHGVRTLPERGTTGWYIWAGDYSDDPDFFVPLHVEHLEEWCPLVLQFLALPPGWRFLTDGSYEDVWQDEDVSLDPTPATA
jgi:hypothetical protein